MERMEHIVSDADAGIRLDRWFKRHFPAVSHALLQKELRKGQVRVEGRKCEASARIEAGMRIQLPAAFSTVQEEAPRHEKVAMPVREQQRVRDWVIYKDADIIALNKPPGIAVQGGTRQLRSIDGMLDALRENGERPRLVHRLDKDTSGVLLLARSAKAAAELAALFAGRDMEKTYEALVIGVPKPAAGVIDLPIAKGSDGNREKMAVDREGGQRAVTEYVTLDYAGKRLAWMQLKPVTGRTHQLRVHMAAIGHPIFGDGKYGGEAAFIEGVDLPWKLHLHAREVRIPSYRGRNIHIRAELSAHMKQSKVTLGL